MRWAWCLLAVLVVTGVGPCSDEPPPSAVSPRADAWPDADVLFRTDPDWLGSDGAFSVPLGDGRILWLFGDTFVATSRRHIRSEAAFVRNTIAIQRGNDPRTASIAFHWRTAGGRPASFFPEDGDRWYWPQHGIRLGDSLVVFLNRVRSKPSDDPAWAFATDGWRVAIVDDVSGDPDRWRVRVVEPGTLPGFLVGSGVNKLGEHVVALAVREPGDHAGYLVRWRETDLAAGRLDDAEWWAGKRGWVPAARLAGSPTAILDDAGAESSLTFDEELERWVHVRTEGFGPAIVVVSFAPEITGPWSRPTRVYRPPESDRPDANVYAAKGHPELAGADLVVTYATNTMARDATLLRDESIYYPRFVRLSLS
jgi:hypothetical protein